MLGNYHRTGDSCRQQPQRPRTVDCCLLLTVVVPLLLAMVRDGIGVDDGDDVGVDGDVVVVVLVDDADELFVGLFDDDVDELVAVVGDDVVYDDGNEDDEIVGDRRRVVVAVVAVVLDYDDANDEMVVVDDGVGVVDAMDGDELKGLLAPPLVVVD